MCCVCSRITAHRNICKQLYTTELCFSIVVINIAQARFPCSPKNLKFLIGNKIGKSSYCNIKFINIIIINGHTTYAIIMVFIINIY